MAIERFNKAIGSSRYPWECSMQLARSHVVIGRFQVPLGRFFAAKRISQRRDYTLL
jgi:hypothetical protein